MLVILLLASISLLAQKSGNDKLKKTFQDINDKMAAAVIAGDSEKMFSFYDEKVISMPEYGEMIRGLEELKTHQAEAEEKGNKVLSMSLKTKYVTDYGDIVVEIGYYDITFQIGGAPAPLSDAGKYLTVWKKYGKEFKILNEIWNTNVYPAEKQNKKPKVPSSPAEASSDEGNKTPKVEKKELDKE